MMPAPHDATKWAQRTFGKAKLGDTRRAARLVDIAGRCAQNTGSSVASVCEGDGAMLEATYRFIRNNAVQPEAIRRAGFEQTVACAQDIPELLALEDTTSLSYKHQVASELGKLGKPTDKARGWWVHSVLLLNSQTMQTVGLVHQEWWCRPDNKEDADEKESGKWRDASVFCRTRLSELMSRVISVCDREADVFDYLMHKCDHGERFVVRGKHLRQVEASAQDLLSHLQEQPVLGCYPLDIPQKGRLDTKGKRKNRATRQARLQVRSANVTFSRGRQQLTLNVVWAQEISPPQGEEPLSWLLLTSEPADTLEAALRVIRIYAARWRVEDFHKAWKTGAGAERQRMAEPDNLERVVSILAFIGIRLLQLRESFTLPVYLKRLGLEREAEQVATQPCDKVLSMDEWQVLVQMDRTTSLNNGQVPSLQWAYLAIARLGGFTDSKRTGMAGWDTLWKGWQRLQERVEGFILAKEMMAAGKI